MFYRDTGDADAIIVAAVSVCFGAGVMSVQKIVKLGIAKLGNIGSAPLLEFLLDERAERQDIEVKVVGSGAKITAIESQKVASDVLTFRPDLALVVSPNASLPGPSKAREVLRKAGVPTIVISDGPSKKAVRELQDDGFGYIIVEADSMIGARREFLDPTEMALFNSDLLKVLAATGVFRLLSLELDRAIAACRNDDSPKLPRVVVDKEIAVEAARFGNEYARSKAMAAYEIARHVAELTVEACFMVKDWVRYTRLVEAGHEMMRVAAKLADEAREIEKNQDILQRTPHGDTGAILSKKKLIEKPGRAKETAI